MFELKYIVAFALDEMVESMDSAFVLEQFKDNAQERVWVKNFIGSNMRLEEREEGWSLRGHILLLNGVDPASTKELVGLNLLC